MSGRDEENTVQMRIESYLRNEMTGDERAAFEREQLREPSLRAAVELERTIDDRLRAMFAPPAPATLEPLASGGSAPMPVPRSWVRLALGLAAVLALAAGVHFSGILGPAPGGTKADAVLARFVRTGFEPAWVCKDDAEFIQYTRDTFGQAFTVAPSADVQVVGWDYCSGVLGDEAGVLLVKLGDDEKAILVVDKRANDRPVEVEPASGLTVHRRKVGSAVLYEVSKRDTPAVLPLVNSVN